METKKIAVACFIGGALCCAVALMFAPAFWWLGLISGIAAGVTSGYISYDFHKVRKAIPIALRAAGKGGVIALAAVVDPVVDGIREWSKKIHPFFYLSLLIGLLVIIMMNQFFLTPEMVKESGFVGIVIMFYLETLVISGILIYNLASLGADSMRCYWQPFFSIPDDKLEEHIKTLHAKGFREEPLTYLNVLRWTVFGFAAIIYFFVWLLWKHLVIGALATSCFLGRFAWHLFKLIHSEKRVLCALDGTLGGVASYIWLASSATSFSEQAVLVIFGGLLGAAFGVANWEIVSKRILHVHASVNNASA